MFLVFVLKFNCVDVGSLEYTGVAEAPSFKVIVLAPITAPD